MGFIIKETINKNKKKGGNGTKDKIEYLIDNLAVIEKQKHLDAIEEMGRFFKRYGEVTGAQEKYLDILIDNVKRLLPND